MSWLTWMGEASYWLLSSGKCKPDHFRVQSRLAVSGSSNPVKLHASANLIPATGSMYGLLADSLFYSVSQGA